ncbi:MAG: DUF1499 domain-containing protein [Rhodospirillales bacterium]
MAAAALLAAGGIGAVTGGAADAEAPAFTDFARLTPPASPNRWLVAPAGYMPAAPDETAPVFGVPAVRLAQAWTTIVERQPRTRVTAVSADGLQVEAEQRSAVFRFVDRISFRAIPLTPTSSTLAAYSRAETGYWDLGVNRRRLRAWLAELEANLGAQAP